MKEKKNDGIEYKKMSTVQSYAIILFLNYLSMNVILFFNEVFSSHGGVI